MARGYPDYFGQSIFPKYGNTKKEGGGYSISAFSLETILELNYRGYIYNGILYINNTVCLQCNNIRIYIDNDLIYAKSLDLMLNYGMLPATQQLVFLMDYSIDNGVCVVGFSNNIPFQYSFKIDIDNSSSGVTQGEITLVTYAIE